MLHVNKIYLACRGQKYRPMPPHFKKKMQPVTNKTVVQLL